MYKWEYTPSYRGFDTYYGYYFGGPDYYDHTSNGYYDFFRTEKQNCGIDCLEQITENDAYGTYNVPLFTERAIDIISKHDKTDGPFFMLLAYESVHTPLQCPQEYVDMYADTIADETRRTYAGMLTIMDESIGNVTDSLRDNGYLDPDGNTVIVFMSDSYKCYLYS